MKTEVTIGKPKLTVAEAELLELATAEYLRQIGRHSVIPIEPEIAAILELGFRRGFETACENYRRGNLK